MKRKSYDNVTVLLVMLKNFRRKLLPMELPRNKKKMKIEKPEIFLRASLKNELILKKKL